MTVTDLSNENKLIFARGHYNIIDCGVRTGKTYWAVNNLQQFTRDGKLNRILFLVDTTALKDQIIEEYDNCVDADTFWEHPMEWGEHVEKIGIMCYQALGMRALKEDLSFLDYVDVICWDECDSIFNFAIQAFTKARQQDFARKVATHAEILAVIQEFSTRKEYMPLILLGAWERIVVEGRIMCIGLSATPERASRFYTSLVQASNVGKVEMGYHVGEDIYFYNLADHVRELSPQPGRGYWCYSPFIDMNKKIVELAKSRGFNAIELHSLNNAEKPMDEEQQRVYNIIVTTGMVPKEYDFVVVNKALERGISIYDNRFDNLIVDSYNAAEREQAARQTFKYQRHLKIYPAVVPDEKKDKWMTLNECREFAEGLAVPELDKYNRLTSRIITWNKLKDLLPAFGYTVEQKRKRVEGKTQICYRITGEWHDAPLEEGGFIDLVEARLSRENDTKLLESAGD